MSRFDIASSAMRTPFRPRLLALAGFLLASRGPGLVYAINAVSFVAVITGLALMRTQARSDESGGGERVRAAGQDGGKRRPG